MAFQRRKQGVGGGGDVIRHHQARHLILHKSARKVPFDCQKQGIDGGVGDIPRQGGVLKYRYYHTIIVLMKIYYDCHSRSVHMRIQLFVTQGF